ncbi:hypothetical protein EDB84DRAFT_932282 [Lactarius hengduanensis]|nr:hypothetical protein EDB84DRAFT_932282 [Lactarius hengduanensis]
MIPTVGAAPDRFMNRRNINQTGKLNVNGRAGSEFESDIADKAVPCAALYQRCGTVCPPATGRLTNRCSLRGFLGNASDVQYGGTLISGSPGGHLLSPCGDLDDCLPSSASTGAPLNLARSSAACASISFTNFHLPVAAALHTHTGTCRPPPDAAVAPPPPPPWIRTCGVIDLGGRYPHGGTSDQCAWLAAGVIDRRCGVAVSSKLAALLPP